MGTNLGTDAILERRDDLPASGVVFGVRREHEHYVQRHSNRIALNLDIAFLHYVKQSDLHLACQVGQLIDREDTPVRARQQPVVNCQLVRKKVPAARGFDRIQISDEIGDGHVGSCELLDVSPVARNERDLSLVTAFFDEQPAGLADRRVRIVVDLAAFDRRRPLIKQPDQLAQYSALCLSAQSEKYEVVPREQGVDDLRHYRIVVADDARKYRLTPIELVY